MKHVPRFYCHGAVAGAALTPDQQHHLLVVLRRGVGDELLLFNETMGEWRATISAVNKKNATIAMVRQEKPAPAVLNKTILYLALLEKSRLDIVIPKAVELGASDIRPVITDFTDRKADEWQRQKEKWQKVATSAAEQSGCLAIPTLHDAIKLDDVMAGAVRQPPRHPIVYGDETGGKDFYQTMLSIVSVAGSRDNARRDIALLVGPPGGFSDRERAMLRAQHNFYGVNLGARILRSETAALAMLAGLLFLCKV